MPTSDDTGSPEKKPAPPSRAKAEALVAQIAALSNRYVPPLLRTMFDQADSKLFEMAAESGETNPQESPHLKTMRELRTSRVDIETRFYQEIAHSYETALMPEGNKTADKEEEFSFDIDSLSLVEDENLEESIAARKLADKLRGKQQSLFDAIDKRLEHLLLTHNGNSHDFPAVPESICGAFSKAIGALELEEPVRVIILKLFEEHVVNELGPFYEELNSLLASEGILPDIQTNKPWRNQVVQRASAPAQAAQAPASEGPPGAAPGAGTGAQPASAPAQAQGAAAVGAAANVAGGTAAAAGGAAQVDTAGASAEVDTALLSVLQNLLNAPGGTGLVPIQPGASIPPDTQLTAVQPAQLLSGLTGLQQQAPVTTGGAAIDSAALKTLLAGNLQAGGDSTFGFQHRESMLIDVISMLFEFILEDTTIPEVAKAQIGRLQIPMVKAALIDESFLAKKANPARQLLNRLAQASAALDRTSGQESPLLQAIIHVVNAITDEFESDMSIFERQLHYLTEALETQHDEDEQIIEQISGVKSKREEDIRSNRRIKDAVRLKLSAVDAPAPVRNLIDSTWRKVLEQTGRKYGMESEQWQERNDFVARLIDSLKPRDDKDERRKLMQTIPLIVGTLRKAMLDSGFGEEAIQQVLKVIEPMHMAIITHVDTGDAIAEKARKHHAMEKALDTMQAEMSHLDEMLESLDGSLLDADYVSTEELPLPEELFEESSVSHEEAISPDDLPDDEFIEAVRNLQIGQVVVLRDNNGNPVRGKLSWKSDLLGEYVFTNWRHKVVGERTLNSLAADLFQGRLEILEDASILERALGKVMGGLGSQQAAQGSENSAPA